jgi:cellulose biosynthesis protein BcsQ
LAETDARREPGFDVALREALESCRASYDFIVIDAPPNLGMLTWTALAAAEDVISRYEVNLLRSEMVNTCLLGAKPRQVDGAVL